MKIIVSSVLLLCAIAAVAQQSITRPAPVTIPQILNRGTGSNVSVYTDRPADLQLIPHEAGARHAQVWLQDIGNGLLIVGEVEGERPDFPESPNWILKKDHVEFWLADANDPALPPVGWGNQFEEVTLPKGADSCADWAHNQAGDTPAAPDASGAEKRCRSWAEKQAHYRSYFQRLFLRQWLVAPDYVIESFAQPAYDQILARYFGEGSNVSEESIVETMLPLKPQNQVRAWFGPGKNGSGYTFEIFVPFSSFPPLSSTELRNFRLMVDVFSAAEPGKTVIPYSTSSPSRIYAKPETFNLVQLEPAHAFHLTPCDLPLSAKDKYGDTHPAWFIPKTTQDGDFQSDGFIVVNDGGGYQYEPEALSPAAKPVHYFWHGISENEWICGPLLTYRRGDATQSFDLDADPDGFDAHHLDGGDLLIKIGPRVYGSAFGSGQCGACPRTDLRIFRLGADLQLKEMLRLGDVVDNGTGASQDFSLSRDWSRVIEYDEAAMDRDGKPAPWSATTWCRGDLSYRQCDHEDKVNPPDPPVLKELRDPD